MIHSTGLYVLSLMCLFYIIYYFLVIIQLKRGRTQALSSTYKTDQAAFTDWMSFLPSNLIRKSALIQKSFMQLPKAFHQHGKAEKTTI